MSSASDLSVAAEDDSNSMLGSRKEEDTFGRPILNRAIDANVMTAVDPQLQPPAQLSTAEVIAGTSRELIVEHTGDHPSHFQYDVV
jgi:hypothetical protein